MRQTFYMPNSTVLKRRPSLAAFQSLETIQEMRPEYVRLPGAIRLTALSRNQLFDAVRDGCVKTIHFKNQRAKKGVRLFHVQSLLEYIERMGK